MTHVNTLLIPILNKEEKLATHMQYISFILFKVPAKSWHAWQCLRGSKVIIIISVVGYVYGNSLWISHPVG